ncbi:hypothetical protein GCM10023335_25330 [Streptomyces siamensis]|uniref:Uncharacterized protein n=1 Tax=Streptomyces siamensis TaxID=1274986 RepID=A0ABP9IRF4_9ACTN
MAQEYCGPSDTGVSRLTPRAIARGRLRSAAPATRRTRVPGRGTPRETQTTCGLGSLRLAAEEPAGRTGEPTGRVTAWDWGRLHARFTCWSGTALDVVTGR